jgi:ABC-2 type transport system permease protein
MFLRKAYAFLKRDFQERRSYKAALLFDLVGVVFSILIFFFIGKMYSGADSVTLREYSTSYFPFVLIGLAFSSYQTVALNSFSQSLGREIDAGTFESILLTSTGIKTIIFAGSLWAFLWTTIRVLIFFLLGILFFSVKFPPFHFSPLIVSILLMLTSLIGLGLISAGFTLIYKRGDPVTFIINGLTKFLSGVYFPVAVLPLPLQYLSKIFPLTHSLTVLRKVLLQSATFSEVKAELFFLICFTTLFLPLGALFFNIAVKKAKREGSLAFR